MSEIVDTKMLIVGSDRIIAKLQRQITQVLRHRIITTRKAAW